MDNLPGEVLTDICALADRFLMALPNINKHLSEKHSQDFTASSTRPPVQRNLNLSLPLKLHLLCKCANTTMFTPMCARVLENS